MNAPHCCETKSGARDEAHPRGAWRRRGKEIAGVIVPGAMVALLPKCPMCLAAYVFLGTGFTWSYSSAHLVIRALTALCLGALAFGAARRIVKHLRRQPSLNLQPTNPLP